MALQESGRDPERLHFEITVSSASPDEFVETREALLPRGCTVLLDDFGTDFSSRPQLNALPLIQLKAPVIFGRAVFIA